MGFKLVEDKNALRYILKEGSTSNHCCFEWTVVDTHKPIYIGGDIYTKDGEIQFESICECFTYEDAERISAALEFQYRSHN